MSGYQGVIFDLDGVLVCTDSYHYRAWKELADREGIPFDPQVNQRLRGVSRMASLEILLEKSPRQYTAAQKQEMAEAKNQAYRQLLQNLTAADVLPGVIAFLKALRDRGLRLAVGSSSRNAPMILQKTGLISWFDAVADGNQIHNSKPDPEVFLLAAKKLGLEARQCIVVEDAAAGIQAAAAAGAKPFAVGAAQGCPGAASSAPDLQAVDLDVFLEEPEKGQERMERN